MEFGVTPSSMDTKFPFFGRAPSRFPRSPNLREGIWCEPHRSSHSERSTPWREHAADHAIGEIFTTILR